MEIHGTSLPQDLRIDPWELEIVNEVWGSVLEGEIAFHVDGGHFPIQGRRVYERDVIGRTSVECR